MRTVRILDRRISLQAMTWLGTAFLASVTLGQETPRYFEQNGVTYKETRRTVPRTMLVTEYEQQQSTVYVPKTTTTLQDRVRTIHRPVTEYQWEPRWEGLWPFQQRTLVWRWVPKTRVETTVETVQVPVTQQHMVAETRTSQVPVVRSKVVQDEVVSRVAVGPAGTHQAQPYGRQESIAQRSTPIGGVQNLENGTPRYGMPLEFRSGQGTRLR